MPRYAAFLRGVMPTNARMADLRNAFEAAGFTDVATVISSGNVVFTSPAASVRSLERQAEVAMTRTMGRSFLTFVRPVNGLRKLLATDPYQDFRLKPSAKRIVTFLRTRPSSRLRLPIEYQGARILTFRNGLVFSAYLPTPKGPVFMTLIEATFGKEQTTRTWDTIARVAR